MKEKTKILMIVICGIIAIFAVVLFKESSKGKLSLQEDVYANEMKHITGTIQSTILENEEATIHILLEKDTEVVSLKANGETHINDGTKSPSKPLEFLQDGMIVNIAYQNGTCQSIYVYPN